MVKVITFVTDTISGFCKYDSALPLWAGGRWYESDRPDHLYQ